MSLLDELDRFTILYGGDMSFKARAKLDDLFRRIAERLREADLTDRKVAHGCTDANCSLCDGK